MSQSAENYFANNEASKTNGDGYKPDRLPNALKVIKGRTKNISEVTEMAEQNGRIFTENMIKNRIVDIYISCENESRAKDWYI
ncbi:hypothetical protein [Paenibacillus thermotolerans]|uniref:hypothetical protein n=1 Tax=Paenibacillus thermotolerans TaxID=3027807 RepID=UPI0023676A48|nr:MULTISPECIES: hypothetical protein [unclassified Paenibacillus]